MGSESLFDADEEEPDVFEFEGFYTHYVCPKCGYNDWAEGDLRGDAITCEECGFTGKVEG